MLFADKNVLVLHSYHHGLEWTDSISKGLISAFDKSKEKTNLYFEYLDSKRHFETSFLNQTFQYFLLKHGDTSFDAIIVSDNDALAFVNQYGNELFPNKPVIFCGINNFTPQLVAKLPQSTGVKEIIDYHGTLSLAHTLFPKKDKVMVVLDNTLTANKILTEMREVEKSFSQQFQFCYMWDFSDAELATFVEKNKETLLVYLLSYNRDKKGNFFSYSDSVIKIQEIFTPNVPIFGSWDFFLDKGIVGGVITTGFMQGKMAGEMAIQVLEGAEVNNIALLSNAGKDSIILDYKVMQKFSLKAPDTLLHVNYINEPTHFFTQYKAAILVVGFCFFISSLLLLVMVIKNREKNKILEQTNELLDQKVQLSLQESEKSEKLFRFIADSSPYVIWIIDTEHTLTYINGKVKEYFMHEPENIIGTQNFKFLQEAYLAEVYQHIKTLKEDLSIEYVQFEFYCAFLDKHMKNYIIPIHASDGGRAGYKGVMSDITQEKVKLDLLKQEAQTDYLTGLLNRTTFEKKLFSVFQEMKKENKELSLLMIDIDYFKKINDTYGHLIGDFVLKKVAKYLSTYFRKSDFIFRYGGEEFVVLLPDISMESAIASAQKIRKLISEQVFRVEEKDVLITVSIGLSMLNKDDRSINSVMIRADEALYKAKRSGRNRVETH